MLIQQVSYVRKLPKVDSVPVNTMEPASQLPSFHSLSSKSLITDLVYRKKNGRETAEVGDCFVHTSLCLPTWLSDDDHNGDLHRAWASHSFVSNFDKAAFSPVYILCFIDSNLIIPKIIIEHWNTREIESWELSIIYEETRLIMVVSPPFIHLRPYSSLPYFIHFCLQSVFFDLYIIIFLLSLGALPSCLLPRYPFHSVSLSLLTTDWGHHTGTIDWCETNYSHSRYIAEFVNSLTNFPSIFLGLYGLYHTQTNGIPLRYGLCFLGLSLIGVGSFGFHASLRWEWQLMDELPMVRINFQKWQKRRGWW